MELSSLNELLDRIAALGVAMDYDRIGLKTDQREINSPPVTHQIAVVEEQCGDSPSILRTNYVRIPELSKPDTRSREDIALTLNLESGCIPNLRGNIPEPKLPRSETPRPGVSDWVKDCREEDAISFFCNNGTDKGILNAISRHDIHTSLTWRP